MIPKFMTFELSVDWIIYRNFNMTRKNMIRKNINIFAISILILHLMALFNTGLFNYILAVFSDLIRVLISETDTST